MNLGSISSLEFQKYLERKKKKKTEKKKPVLNFIITLRKVFKRLTFSMVPWPAEGNILPALVKPLLLTHKLPTLHYFPARNVKQ